MEKKKRHFLLTGWLILIMVYHFVLAIMNLIMLPSLFQISSLFLNEETGQSLVLLFSSIFTIVCLIGLFQWKKWGFWGFVGLNIAMIIFYFASEMGSSSLYPLLAIAILYGLLQVGGENKAWTQLE
jgi:hypothetical protein